MKHSIINILIAVFTVFSLSVNAVTITSTVTGGNWATASTWDLNRIPGSTDDVVIATTGVNSVIGATGVTVANLTVNSGSLLTLTTAQLTITGAVNNVGTITATSGRIMQTGGIGDFTNSGIITFTGSGRIYFSGNMTNTGTMTLASTEVRFYGADAVNYTVAGFTTTGLVVLRRTAGSVTFTGNVNGGGLEINGTGGTLDLGAGLTHTFTGIWTRTAGILLGNSSKLRIGGSISGTTGTFTAGTGTVEYFGAAQTCAVVIYNNLTLSGSGAKTFASFTSSPVNGILSMEGTATVTASTGAVIYGPIATLQYNTATARTVSSEEWPTTFTASGGVIIANAGIITLNAAKVFNLNCPLTINSLATLTPGTRLLTFGGDFINNGALTSGIGGVTIANTATNQTIDGFTTTGPVSMTKASGTATLNGNVNGASLTISSAAGTLNLGAGLTHTITGIWTRTAGTLDGGSSTLKLGSTVTNTAGTFTASAGTVEYYAAGIQTVAPLIYNNLTLSGTSSKTTTGVTVTGILSMEGTATASAVPTYGGLATLQYKGSALQTTGVEFATPFPGSGGVKINNAIGVTLGFDENLGANPLTIGDLVPNSKFNDGGKALTATGTLNLTSGTYKVGLTTTATSLPAFTTTNIAASTTVEYAATAAQTIKGVSYSNLTISGTGANSKTADADITVDGILNLASANASATQGCLSMSTFTLNMGAAATTTGTGDVTGIVKRTQTFENNTPYSFGNQFTDITFLGISGSTKPTWLSCKIDIGTAPSWRPVGLKRTYSFAQNGGTDQVITNLHYLDSELNTATQTPYEPDETQLVFWDGHGGSTWTLNHPHGKSNSDATNNLIGRAGFAISYLADTALDLKQWGLSYSNTIKNTWQSGSDHTNPTKWDDSENWSAGHTPLTTEDVLIPGSYVYYPTLTSAIEVKTLEIASGASLSAGSYGITINGFTGAWLNNGTFNGNTGTVIFSNGTIANVVSMSGTGTNNFNDITINANTYLQPSSGSYLKIAGAVTNNGIVDLKATTNTIEYNGTGQSILNLQGPASDIGYSNLIINSSGTTTLPATLNVMRDLTINTGTTNATAASSISVLGNVTLTAGTFTASSSAISVGGNWTNNGATFTPGTSTITFNNIVTSQAINGTAASQIFNNLTVNKTAQTLSVGGSATSLTANNYTQTSGNFTAPATFNINGAATLTIGTYTAGANTNIIANWTNTAATFTAGTGTVTFVGSSAQNLSGINTFHNLTINNTAGLMATGNQTVNGVLYLQTNNPSATQGSLMMSNPFELTMGSDATTTGAGDVTGIITRNSFVINTPYSFGNEHSTVNLSNYGTLPTSISVKVVLVSPNPFKSNGIHRYYDIIQSGSPTTKVSLNLHYLDSELNGAIEGDMDLFDYHVPFLSLHDHGSSNFNTTNNWVGLSNMSLPYIANTLFDKKYFTLGTSTSGNDCTWLGISSGNTTDWNDAGNWTGGIPNETSHVHIPNTTNHPTLPASTTIGILNIEAGGVLNGGTGTILTISGSSGAWDNLGTFNAGTSTVVFTNAAATMADPTNFYNLTIADGASLTLGTDNIMRIAGVFSLSTNGVLNAGNNQNTVEYNGGDQMVVYPNGSTPGYHNLILSGTGTKSMPTEPLHLHGELTLSGTVSVTAGSDITVNGIHSNVIIDAGCTFNASAFTHIVAGDWTNNGTFTAGTSTINFNGAAAQTIAGVNTFNNVTINSAGVTATANQTVNGILDLQSANASDVKGSLDMGAFTLNMGADATTTGTGDVSGIVRRTTINTGTVYTFGNQLTTITFPSVGTIPTAISMNIILGTAPTWKTNAIKRQFIVSQTGGSGTKAVASLHYLDSELNANTENQMIVWVKIGESIVERGRSSYDLTSNFLTLTDVNFQYLVDYNISLGNSATTVATWNGSQSTAWNTSNNWTPAATPTNTIDVIIPDASLTPNDPEFSSTVDFKTITIENGGILNSTTDAQVNITGTSGAWNNQGTFNQGSSTVVFKGTDATLSGTTDFNNVTIYSDAALRNDLNSSLRIGGTVTNNGTWDAATFENTVEYYGASQSIINPNGTTSGYHNLTLSGSGTKTASGALALLGNLTVGVGTTFAAGAGNHAIAGNIVCDGTITPSTSTVTMNGSTAQNIGGIAYPSFNNLTIDNAAGVTLVDSASVAGTLQINTAKKLVIASKAKMVAQTITNSAGTSGLVLKSNDTDANGTLIFNNAVESPVTATVEMYSKAIAQTYNAATNKYSNYKWQFCGIPVASIGVLGPINGGYIRQWGESTGSWTQLQNANTLTAFTGYEITQPFAKTYSFSGSLINSDKTVTLTKGTGNGMNLIGNPYTAAINIKSLSFASSGVDKTVYLYNTGSSADWATQTGTDWSPGQYILATQALAGIGGIPAQIPSMTAFFVRATTNGSTLTIPYSAVAKNIDRQRTKAITSDKVYTIIDVKGNSFADRMWLFTDNNCTHSFDNGWDGSKLLGSALNPQLYAQEIDGNYQIDAVDNVNNTYLAFQAGVDTYYTLTFTHENIESTYSALYLIDMGNNNKVTDITLSGTQYTFTATSTPTAVNRFKIVTSLGVATQNENIGNGSLKIHNFESTIFIDNKKSVDGEFKLYNLSGQLVKQIQFSANCISNHRVDLSPGSYIIKAEAGTERVTENLIIR